VAGSVLAIGSVHSWAYVPLFWACLAVLLLAVERALAVRRLRALVGPRTVAFAPDGRGLVLDAEPAYGGQGWRLDLGRPAFGRPSLLLPGVVFVAWALVTLLPFGGSPLSVSPADTRRGVLFLASLLGLHVAAAALFESRAARVRFRAFLAGLALVLGVAALAQFATGTRRVYGLFTPEDSGGQVFGPFVNRNHFAGYMLLVLPTSLAVLARAVRKAASHGGRGLPRARLLRLLSGPGAIRLIYAALPPVAAACSLVATLSRGGLLAFVVAGLLTLAYSRGGRAVRASLLAAAALVTAFGWHGLERVDERLQRSAQDAPGRTLVWRDALARMQPRWWWTGSGFNTYATAVSHTAAWALPEGATHWPAEVLARGPRPAVRVPPRVSGFSYYSEAHNDYVQVLVEAGIPGLLLAWWAAARALRAARRNLWLLWAVLALLLHALVEFVFQIPALPVLFVVLLATGRAHGKGAW